MSLENSSSSSSSTTTTSAGRRRRAGCRGRCIGWRGGRCLRRMGWWRRRSPTDGGGWRLGQTRGVRGFGVALHRLGRRGSTRTETLFRAHCAHTLPAKPPPAPATHAPAVCSVEGSTMPKKETSAVVVRGGVACVEGGERRSAEAMRQRVFYLSRFFFFFPPLAPPATQDFAAGTFAGSCQLAVGHPFGEKERERGGVEEQTAEARRDGARPRGGARPPPINLA